MLQRFATEFAKRRGHFVSGDESLWPLVKKAARNEFQKEGPQRRFVELCYDKGVLIADPELGKQRIYFDELRADYVASCCEALKEPDQLDQPNADRIQRILRAYESLASADERAVESERGDFSETSEPPPSSSRLPPPPIVPRLSKTLAHIHAEEGEDIAWRISSLSDERLISLRDAMTQEITRRETRASLQKLIEEKRRLIAEAEGQAAEALRSAEEAERIRLQTLEEQHALEEQLKMLDVS